VRFRLSLQSTLLCLALITSAAFLRLTFLSSLTRDINSLNFGGDPCHHYNIAWNIARGNGPVTDFIFSYWFRHPALPALTDIYPPGVHYVLAFFLRILGEDYGSARLACLIFGSIAACPVYFMARHFLGRGLSFTAAAIVVLNAVHLEHSTVVMTPVIASFFVWLAVLAFLRLKGAYGWKGALAGWAHLCMSAVPPLILAFLVSESIQWRIERFPVRELFRRAIATGLGLGVVLAPWAYKTYSYFGKVFYTNFKFYPITDSWVPMNWQTTPPSWAGFVAQSGGLWKVAHLYLVQFGRGLAQVTVNHYRCGAPIAFGSSLLT
jgi:4-amino-4-deoxy-L-arabinose transferase-like glycosyltransferase